MERGEITVGHARYLAEQTRDLDAAARTCVEQRVLPHAAGQSHGDFRRAVRRARQTVDERRAEERHVAAREQRTVQLWPADDGMAHLYANLPADAAHSLYGRLTAIAQQTCEHDTRTLDQRRADALVDLAGAGSAERIAAKPAVHVTVALSTLLELDDQPGEFAGHGPIPATLAREIAADPSGSWRRLVTDDVVTPYAPRRRRFT